MKKIFLSLAILILLLFAGLYFLLPNSVNIKHSVQLNANPDAVLRYMADKENWKQWWPQNGQVQAQGKNAFMYDNSTFVPQRELYNGYAVTVYNGNDTMQSIINAVPLDVNSIVLEWSGSMQLSGHLFHKLSAYIKAKKVSNDIEDMVSHLQTVLSDPTNVYGSAIEQTKVKDTVIVTANIVTNGYPSVNDVYAVVEKLKGHIQKEGATETGPPMMHTKTDGNTYYSMIGIPVDTLVTPTNNITVKRMILGNILVTEVKGGAHTIQHALQQMEYFITDNKLTSPAVPYESLVTNRQQVQDTNKWITKIYYPIF